MALYPALRVGGVDEDLALAAVDDHAPVAAQSAGDACTIFFASRATRDAAASAVSAQFPSAVITSLEVDDEDWARRSQEGLEPVTVGRVTVRPTRDASAASFHGQRPGATGRIDVVVLPSMGFGTGHHATTRLCLDALQRLTLNERTVLDVGTGSGILALVARALGARRALGLDVDPDAIASARENLAHNPQLDHVSYELCDLTRQPLPTADIVVANLTGSLLCRAADLIMNGVSAPGSLITSGVLQVERDAVVRAFSRLTLSWEGHEDEWVGLVFDRTPAGRAS